MTQTTIEMQAQIEKLAHQLDLLQAAQPNGVKRKLYKKGEYGTVITVYTVLLDDGTEDLIVSEELIKDFVSGDGKTALQEYKLTTLGGKEKVVPMIDYPRSKRPHKVVVTSTTETSEGTFYTFEWDAGGEAKEVAISAKIIN